MTLNLKINTMKLLRLLTLLSLIPSYCLAVDDEPIDNPDGWTIIKQRPCDSFIVFQNNKIRDSNFIYFIATNNNTSSVKDLTDIFIKKMECLNEQIHKTSTGGLHVTCSNNMSINVWESVVSFEGLDEQIFSALILKNMHTKETSEELPRLMQTSMLFQDKVINVSRKGLCSENPPDTPLPEPIILAPEY